MLSAEVCKEISHRHTSSRIGYKAVLTEGGISTGRIVEARAVLEQSPRNPETFALLEDGLSIKIPIRPEVWELGTLVRAEVDMEIVTGVPYPLMGCSLVGTPAEYAFTERNKEAIKRTLFIQPPKVKGTAATKILWKAVPLFITIIHPLWGVF